MPESLPGTSLLIRAAGCAALAALSLVVGAAQAGQATLPSAVPATAQLPAAQLETQAPQNPGRRELADESARLLSLAISLKAEVDKTNKDMLSLNVIRKADEIEKLAHSVREKMKSAGS